MVIGKVRYTASNHYMLKTRDNLFQGLNLWTSLIFWNLKVNWSQNVLRNFSGKKFITHQNNRWCTLSSVICLSFGFPWFCSHPLVYCRSGEWKVAYMDLTQPQTCSEPLTAVRGSSYWAISLTWKLLLLHWVLSQHKFS